MKTWQELVLHIWTLNSDNISIERSLYALLACYLDDFQLLSRGADVLCFVQIGELAMRDDLENQ
jgi:hypothetical protein